MFKYIIILMTISFMAMPLICMAEEDVEDVLASVVVLRAFDIEIDQSYINFGLVEPGQSVTLKPDTYYNKIKCISNKGMKYYIKIDILGDIMGPAGSEIPPSSFKWKVYNYTGSGTPISGWQEFSEQPVLVYTSSTEDELGNEVEIRFQYKLDLPAEAVGGHYSLQVAYTLTEEE